MSAAQASSSARGTWVAVAAFVTWGLAPLYWHLLEQVPSLQIVLHRVVWSAVFVSGYLFWRDGRQWIRKTLSGQPKLWWMLGLSGLLISCNWGLYIWAVNAGHVVETALGYFINPLLNVVIGVLFLRERLRVGQWLSVAIAFVGVLWLTVQYGKFPWIALALAVSFGVYGVLRKLAHVDSVSGLGIESAYLFPLALIWLLWIELNGGGGFAHGFGATDSFLLILSGILTALPLVGFAYAVRRISLTTVGLLQYIAPTLQFLIGVFVFHEAFDKTRLIGFICIWLALLVFIVEGLLNGRRMREADLAELA
ncbi:MAG: EamA family transporter RarD [Thermomonas sp.]|uniref:EamA family transporter RarD n=1 Tax=Thermomonas sp. TaxID=1971895 RepID=UPI001ECD05D1|nr:EamA family transporter RarD [Thermomonas sp.]MBV2209702.1 EamA family transporter RarD [Thermomonas sp.]